MSKKIPVHVPVLDSVEYSFPQPKMSVKCLFITNLVPRKVEKENHIRKVQKSEERKVKNIGKVTNHSNSPWN